MPSIPVVLAPKLRQAREVQFVNESSPQVFDADIAHTYVEIGLAALWLVISSFLLYGLYLAWHKANPEWDTEGIVFYRVIISCVGGVVFILWGTSIDHLVYGILAFDYATLGNITALLP